ncbi:hypothetical protein GWK47_000485 [Chionoecetes opilio]|uniref:RNase H type-1 domain-containing protein n=1 Tax=Chionoecetes opilio TaxID=41210 RepID=A0A8J4YBE0_CHIOP|nr:hypothetical protein GWK47_000485 [Chionoecetes opilio]
MFPWLKWIMVLHHGGFLRLKSPSLPLPRQTHHSSRSNWLWSTLPQCPPPSLPFPISTSTVPCSQMGARGPLSTHWTWRHRREAGLAADYPTCPALPTASYTQLQGLLLAGSLLCQRRLESVVMCDSQSALQVFSSPQPTHRCLVHQILLQLVAARDNSLTIRFLWIRSHVGIAANDKVDLLAKTACGLPLPDGATPSLLCFKQLIHSAAFLPTLHRTNAERAQSVSIQHYDHFRLSPPKYRRRGLMGRRHNIVSARLRLGYRPVWQVSEAGTFLTSPPASCVIAPEPTVFSTTASSVPQSGTCCLRDSPHSLCATFS